MPRFLQRAGFLTMPLDLDKGDNSIGEKYKAVGHPIKTGACKLGRDTPHRLDRLDEFLFYCFFSHITSDFPYCRLPVFSYNYYAGVLRVPITLIYTYIN